MKIHSIGSNYIPKLNNTNPKPAFKADVRINAKRLEHFEEKPRKIMQGILDKYEHAYDNVGSDNILIRIEPYCSNAPKAKDRFYCFDIRAGFKDIEKARLDILDSAERRNINPNNSILVALKNKTSEIMESMKKEELVPTKLIYEKDLPGAMDENFDETVKSIIRGLSNGPPS